MGFKKGAWATVWDTKPSSTGKSTAVRLSTRKKVADGEYKQDFGRYCLFVGDANTKASALKEKDRICIGDCEVTNDYIADENREVYTFLIYDFDISEDNNSNTNKTSSKKPQTAKKQAPAKKSALDDFDDIIDEDDPF